MFYILGSLLFIAAAIAVYIFPSTKLLAYRFWFAIAFGFFAVVILLASSATVIAPNSVGHLSRIYFAADMKPGQVIALSGQKGPQAWTLPPGFHLIPLLNVLYELDELSIIEIPRGKYGEISANDGGALRKGQFMADGWPESKYEEMLNAEYFLEHGGQKGPQLTVLKPGKYRLNRYLFKVDIKDAFSVEAGEVGVIKSNVQEVENCTPVPVPEGRSLSVPLVPKGCIGVWNEPLYPGMYYLNLLAYTPTKLSTRAQVWNYAGGYVQRFIDLKVGDDGKIEQTERKEKVAMPAGAADPGIFVRVEGWLVPLELRMVIQVSPEDAPFVVASVGDLEAVENKIITPTTRSIVRNVVGGKDRKVLELIEDRQTLETLVEQQIVPEGHKAGISIKEVRFGDPAIPPELLVARLRQQLAGQLQETYREEKRPQDETFRTEKARATADKQPELVAAEIRVKVAEQEKEALKLRGEGEKLRLTEISAGQRAQVSVLGEDRVLYLAALKELLAAAVENPNIVKVPGVLVDGRRESLEGAAAILGNSTLVRGLLSSGSSSLSSEGTQ